MKRVTLRYREIALAATFVLFAACSAVSVWLYLRYQQAENAFRASTTGRVTLSLDAHGHVTVPGLQQQALADQRLTTFYIFFGITTFLAAILLVQVLLRRKQRLSSMTESDQTHESEAAA